MSLTDTISPNAATPKPLSSPIRDEVRKGKDLPEKDLFHKYILDKESKAAARQSDSYQGKALEHDSEIHARQGMLTSHSNPGQKPNHAVKGQTSKSITKDGTPPQKNDSQNLTENYLQPVEQKSLQARTTPTQAKQTLNSASQRGQSKVANQPVPVQAENTAKSETQQRTIEKATNLEVAKSPVSSIKKGQAQQAKQTSANSQNKSGEGSQNNDLHAVKSSEKGNHSGTQSDNSGNHSQQQLPQQEISSALNELIPQQQSAPTENFSLQQAAMASANGTQASAQANTYSGPVAQLAQQIFRLQENGGTSRVTLDMPDGEKLLVRFNVSPNTGAIKVRFATKSPELREAIEKSWNHLRVEANERGVELDIPEFDSEESLTKSF